ncbi:hypothetical protein DYB37_006653 [Aphanomyces astaci]|uniref:Polycystin cation channel PKD1/PKD2 domain-containing protein n=1 Tax=Aphanomyces astaci TaxID=112090 RepID=A0A3R7BA79_APHAT|nr:hypothetical protein DYB37_006653 [Aphanomyces astaci]
MATHCPLGDDLASSVGEGWQVYPLGRNIRALRLGERRGRRALELDATGVDINYIVFLALFLAATFHGRNDNSFSTRVAYLSQLQDKPLAHASAFRSFYTMSSIRELHDYLLQGQNCTGALALVVPPLFPRGCYPELTTATESLDAFGAPNGTVYFARTAMPSEPYFVTKSARVYGAPRFVLEIPSAEPADTCDDATKVGCPVYDQLASLATHKFVDVATRVLFIDLTTYNPNTDEQTSVRLLVEFTKGGGFTPQVECMSYRLYRNNTTSDMVRLGLELLVLLLVVVQLRQEFQLMRRMKWAYLSMVANVAHVFSLVVFAPLVALRVLCYMHLPSPTAIDLTAFTNFRTSIWYYALADAVTSFTFFLSWLKLFKFLAFLPLFAPLTKTVTKAAKQVAGLILIFGVALTGSALSFTMAFGLDAENYKTVADSCIQYTAHVLVAYVETKGELELMKAMHMDTLSKQVLHHILHDVLFNLPGCGARLQRRYGYVLDSLKAITEDKKLAIDECRKTTAKSTALHANSVKHVKFKRKVKPEMVQQAHLSIDDYRVVWPEKMERINRKTMMLMGVNEDEMIVILKKIEELKGFSAQYEIKDMVLKPYLMFLALFIVVTVDISGHFAPDSPYRVTAMLNAQLRDKPFRYKDIHVKKTFDTIKTVQELHQYLSTYLLMTPTTGPFYDVVFAGDSFDGDNEFPHGDLYADRGYLGGNTRLVGPIRIGQIRVKAEVCGGAMAAVPGLFTDPVQCFNTYSASTESTTTFGYHFNYTALSPKPVEPRFYSHMHHWYGSPTFGEMVPSTEADSCDFETKVACPVYDQLVSLKEHKYFDKATRAVFIDLNLYTANIDHTTSARLFAEMLPGGEFFPRGGGEMGGGGVTTQVEFLTYRLYPWHDTADFIQSGCEGLIYVVVLVKLRGEVALARRVGRRYFSMFSNLAIVCNYLLFLFVLGFRALSFLTLPSALSDSAFVDLRYMMDLLTTQLVIPMFGQLTKTVTRSAGKVLELVVIFVLTLVGAALAFYLAFGNFATNYHTFQSSFYTLLHIVTGEMSLTDLRLANRVLGPFFFISFVFLMMFIILNIFIVIVSEAYTDTKKELHLMKEMALDTLSKEIAHHFLHEFVYRVPILGVHVFQPLIEGTSKAIAKVNLNATEVTRANAPVVPTTTRAPVAAETSLLVAESCSDATDVAAPVVAITKPTLTSPLTLACYDKLVDIEHLLPACLERLQAANDLGTLKAWLNHCRSLKAQLDEIATASHHVGR